MVSVHLGFDMGIRNLAFCLMEHAADKTWKILAWDNVDLMAGGQSSQTSRQCCACSTSASWCFGELELWCKACATGVRRKKTATRIPSKPALSCGQTVKELRELATKHGWDKKAKKDELLRLVSETYLLPWKAPKTSKASLQQIRKQMDIWLTGMLPIFAKATLIRLENQPVMKGPTMKSIQIMLFTLLAHRLETELNWKGEIVFVHAGTKTKHSSAVIAPSEISEKEETALLSAEGVEAAEAEAGAAYRERKKDAEQQTLVALDAVGISQVHWRTFFLSRSKKSDLADAFLMALRE